MAVDIDWSTLESVSVASLTGSIDSTNAGFVLDAVLEQVGDDAQAPVLEMSGAKYLSSAGLGAMLQLAPAFRPPHSFRVCGLADTVREVFELSGFSRIVTLRDSLADAVDKVTGHN